MTQSAACRLSPLSNDCDPTDEQLDEIMAAAARTARAVCERVDAEFYVRLAAEVEATRARARARGSIFARDHD